jgi:hypothetical protein
MSDYEKYNIRGNWDDEDIFAEEINAENEFLCDTYIARTWKDNDLMYDHIEGAWVHPDDADEVSDLVQWECHTCHQQVIFDLFNDQVDLCSECGTCYFCDNNADACNCYIGEK